MSFRVRALRRLGIVAGSAALATCAMAATAGSASASATLTIAEYGATSTYPAGLLTVFVTTSCSAPSGTATLSVSATQFVLNHASGYRTITIPCTSQPTTQSVELSTPGCNPVVSYNNCFMANSTAFASATLLRNGVQEATTFRTIHT